MKRILFFFCFLLSISEVYTHEVINNEFETLIEAVKLDCHSNFDFVRVKGGLSNHNFIIYLDGQAYFLKMPGQPSDITGNDIEREMLNTKTASDLGIAPKIIYYSRTHNAILSQYIHGNGQYPNTHSHEVMASLMLKVRKLHDSQQEFQLRITPYEFLDRIYDTAKRIPADLPDVIDNEILPFICQMKQHQLTLPLVPCHMDLHHKNIIDDGQDFWIIDWEYSASCDPYFDLALLSSTDNFTDEEMKQLLILYNGKFDQRIYEHLYQLRIIADLYWGLWCFVSAKMSDIDFSKNSWGNTNSYHEWGNLFLNNALERVRPL